MTTQTKIDVIQLAISDANDWFRLQKEADVPELDPPDEAWAGLNRTYTDNAKRTEGGPMAMDRLYECAFRAEMARLWQHESERAVRTLCVGRA